MLRLDDHWVWDSWVADDGKDYHLFFLKALAHRGGPDVPAHAGAVGHAVSTDLGDVDRAARRAGAGTGRRLGRPGDLDRLGRPG